MRMRPILRCALLLAAAPAPIFAAAVDDASANFTVNEQTMVPGTTLQPGSYSIRVLDHLQDRYIVRIDSTSGDVHSTFIGVQDPQLKSTNRSGVVPWSAAPAGSSALRGFTFGASAPALEFVYPKADAVALAKLNGSKVPAIDPASEGRPADVNGLSKEDREIVTLWMLSSSRVGPGDAAPSIKAEKYSQVASDHPPKPVVARLPHTASLLPLTVLAGLLSVFGASMLAVRRVVAARRSF